jgi:predicted Zn-dependent protease
MNKKTVIGSLLWAVILLSGCGAGLIQRAESKYAAQDYPAAANLFRVYLDQHPDAYLARRKLAVSLLKEGRPREAVMQLEKSLSDQPHDTLSKLYLGLAYLRLGEWQKTLAGWQQLAAGGRPLIRSAVSLQGNVVAREAPNISRNEELDALANRVEAALEEALLAEQQRNAYNTSRLGDCG